MLLANCATSGKEIEVTDTSCQWVAPIYISKNDVLTDGTARQILAHNKTWETFCDVHK